MRVKLQAANESATGPENRWLAAALALGVVCAVYLTTAATLHPSVFWSPDEGAKFIQMHSRLVSPEADRRIAYGAAQSDPLFKFYPTAPIYPRPLWPAGVRNHWPPLFPALALPFFRRLGIWGVYAIPLTGGILTALLAGLLARRLAPGAAAPAILLAGLASPLYFHSTLFLEHSLACALALGVLLCGWNLFGRSVRHRLTRAIGAAACLAGFYALRDEALLFFAALICAGVATQTTGWKRMLGLAGLALTPLLLIAARAVTVAAHGDSRAAEILNDAVNAMAGLQDPALWRALPRHVLHVLVNNPEQSGVPLPPEWAAAGLLGITLCVLSPSVVSPRRFACWLVGVCLITVSGLYGLCLPDRYRAIHGLLLPMPGLALAWLPAPDDNPRPGQRGSFLTALLTSILIIHLLATWLLRRPAGGPEWGLRYAMVAYLLAAVLGAAAVIRFARASAGLQRCAGLALAALLSALSCGFGVRGIFELQVTKRDLHAFEREIQTMGAPVVTDQWWLAAALAPTFVRTDFYTLNPETELSFWLARIGARTPAFLYVSYAPPSYEVHLAHGLTAILTQRRIVEEMTFSRFAVRRR
jgi:hypothetical protein